jgi:hypothetical protein
MPAMHRALEIVRCFFHASGKGTPVYIVPNNDMQRCYQISQSAEDGRCAGCDAGHFLNPPICSALLADACCKQRNSSVDCLVSCAKQ